MRRSKRGTAGVPRKDPDFVLLKSRRKNACDDDLEPLPPRSPAATSPPADTGPPAEIATGPPAETELLVEVLPPDDASNDEHAPLPPQSPGATGPPADTGPPAETELLVEVLPPDDAPEVLPSDIVLNVQQQADGSCIIDLPADFHGHAVVNICPAYEEGRSQWNQGVGMDSVIAVDETLGDINEMAERTHSDGAAEVEGHIAEGTRGRKRKRQPENWKRHVRQKARSRGLPYVTRNGIHRPQKQPVPFDCGKCRFCCSVSISDDDRATICREYYSLEEYNVKKQFLCNLVLEEPVKRKRSRSEVPNPKKVKNKSRAYYLYASDGSKKRVCQKFFCKTFAISFRVVDTALAGRGESGAFVGGDKRIGRPAPNKINEDRLQHIRDHINSFPKVLPHYCRKNTQKQYLSPDLNIKQMYRLYRDDYCVRMKISPVKEHKYRDVFTHEFNLRCFTPKKDQCSLCNSYYEATGEDPLLAKKWEEHKQREKESMEEKANDKQRVSKDNTTSFAAVSFDLEAVLVTPHAGDAQIYYKRKLAVYNLTLYETASHQGYCYVWDETEGGRGSNEIGSALIDYLKNLPSTITHVATFSDTCSGQNRNVYVAAAMLFATQTIPNLQVVDMKFMESGHSYLEADSMHATIEKAFRHKKVYTTHEWELLIGCARKQAPPFVVRRRFHTDVNNLKTLATTFVKNRSKNTDGELVRWLNIKWMRFAKNRPYVIQYKYSIASDTFLELDTSTARGRRTSISRLSLVPAYNNRIPITTAKKNDLLSLITSGVIPKENASFYHDLPSSAKTRDCLPVPDASEETDQED